MLSQCAVIGYRAALNSRERGVMCRLLTRRCRSRPVRLTRTLTAVTMPAASRMPVAFESVPFDQDRWNAWVTKGRLADAAFTEQVRMLAMLGVMVGIGAGTVWIFLG